MTMETIWTFKTANYRIDADIAPSEYPDISWMDDEQRESVAIGRLVFFDTRISVYKNGKRIGETWLGESCYYDDEMQDFITAHRDADPMNRNSSIMRAAKGDNVVICHYFPSMVKEAIDDARATLAS